MPDDSLEKTRSFSLKRSLTARHIPSLTKKTSSRARASSFTTRFRPAQSNITQSSATTTATSPPSPFLTVDDATCGPTSSVGSDSEDGDAFDNEKIPDPNPFRLSASHPLKKKLSTSFKEKLNLTRRSTTPRHGFHLWKPTYKDEQRQQPKLYDDAKGPYPPPPTVDPNRRDQYGFTRSTQWVTTEEYDAFEQQYNAITYRRSQKWRALLEEHNGEWPQRSSKFKRYIRKGIPPEYRRQAWLHYSGGEMKMKQQPGVYQQCVQRAMALGTTNEHLDIIERDLHRTFPDNIHFKPTTDTQDEAPAIQSLRRILYAFSVYSPSIGYCQSLNYIAGLLLLLMAEEEEVFWTFVALIHDILPPNVYDVTMEGANIDQNILMMLLSERCPSIWQRVSGGQGFWDCEQDGMPTTSLVTSHWFLTLFINILPTESVLRVWDCLFYEGRRALMRVALAIFKLNEQAILAVNDPLEVFQVVQNMPKRMVDCHLLMDATWHKYGSLTRISDQALEKKRQMFKVRRDQKRRTTSLKRRHGGGTLLFKAKERLVERAKTVRQK